MPGGSVVNNLLANTGDTGSIPEWGRCPRDRKGNPPQYTCLENPMDRGAWWLQSMGLQKSQAWLSNYTTGRYSACMAAGRAYERNGGVEEVVVSASRHPSSTFWHFKHIFKIMRQELDVKDDCFVSIYWCKSVGKWSMLHFVLQH